MIKVQVLVNFIIKLVRREPEISNSEERPDWVLYFDGSTNQTGGGDGIILEGSKGIMVEHSLCFNF